MPSFIERLHNTWNAFRGRDRPERPIDYGAGYSYRQDRYRPRMRNEKSLINAVINRIAIDVSSIAMLHVRLDQNGRYMETINSPLNNAMTLEANTDQIGRALFLDAVESMCDEGNIAILPVDTDIDPDTGFPDIYSLRVCKIIEWFPQHVRIRGYDERIGRQREIVVPKSTVAIVENPLHSIMNEPNSIFQRLIRKTALLDAIDEQTSSGKLDLIIQLPYTVRSETKQQYAEKRRTEIEKQLIDSKYGIGYIDATEHVIQLNRPIENNLLSQIEYLTNTMYSQLGITPEILNGTADEKTMLNYYNRIVEPILSAFADEFKRKFLSKKARTQGQSIMFIRDPFKLVPVGSIADIADKFTRNEILSANEIRGLVGFRPVDDPKADQLLNSNLNHNENERFANTNETKETIQNETK